MSNIREIVREVINENAKVNFAGHQFMLKVDVNEDPQKKGVKIQFLPTEFGSITKTEQNDIAIELEQRLEQGLNQYDFKVERDRNLKDKTIIGFFIYIEYFDRMVRAALKQTNPNSSPAADDNEEI
mgnify:CR=1 FL=1|jgi:hypothetical protein|tara:strand:- start:627 stop:1004 length:378 start_codon:yes stop_codon:yes gene_type:complete